MSFILLYIRSAVVGRINFGGIVVVRGHKVLRRGWLRGVADGLVHLRGVVVANALKLADTVLPLHVQPHDEGQGRSGREGPPGEGNVGEAPSQEQDDVHVQQHHADEYPRAGLVVDVLETVHNQRECEQEQRVDEPREAL